MPENWVRVQNHQWVERGTLFSNKPSWLCILTFYDSPWYPLPSVWPGFPRFIHQNSWNSKRTILNTTHGMIESQCFSAYPLANQQRIKPSTHTHVYATYSNMYRWMEGCMYGWMDGWMFGCLDVCMYVCMDGWVGGWMDGWCVCVCVCMCIPDL